MTPRWTIDDAWEKRRAVCFMDSDDRHWTVEEDDWLWASEDVRAEATDALVAAVRDADTLRQAREQIRNAVFSALMQALYLDEAIDDDQEVGTRITDAVMDRVLPLLCPAPQGEGTE